MTKLPQIFSYENKQVRTKEINGTTWFVGKDVCNALEIKNNRQALDNLAEDEKLKHSLDISGQSRMTWLVNEPGLYRLIFRSNMPKADDFRRWVLHEVLPSIRRTGSYTVHLSPDQRDEITTHHGKRAPYRYEKCSLVDTKFMRRENDRLIGFLCSRCYDRLDTYAGTRYPSQDDYNRFVADAKPNEPRRGPQIPRWLYDAVVKGMVAPNADCHYIVGSRRDTALFAVKLEK